MYKLLINSDWFHELIILNKCFVQTLHKLKVLFRSMIDYAKERLCINSKSIHQSGISNGGILSYSIIAKLRFVLTFYFLLVFLH